MPSSSSSPHISDDKVPLDIKNACKLMGILFPEMVAFKHAIKEVNNIEMFEALQMISCQFAMSALQDGVPAIVIRDSERIVKAASYQLLEEMSHGEINFDNFVRKRDYVYDGDGVN